MDAEILFVFKIGHSVYRRRNPTPDKTHHWRCVVESWNDQFPLSEFVNNVVFRLHETFKNPKQTVYKEPFAIEEDGFGSFRLFARVYFLNVFTDLHYDITLHDNCELHAFRTVRFDPASSDEWVRYMQYGGIPIPKSATSSDVLMNVVGPIQSMGGKCNLPVTHFYSHLADTLMKQVSVTPTSIRSRPNRESRNQALANLGVPLSQSLAPGLPPPNSSATLTQPPAFKHKKKLQLKHEAQLRLEKQHHSPFNASPMLSQGSSDAFNYPAAPPAHFPPSAPPTAAAGASIFALKSEKKERLVLRLSLADLQIDGGKRKSKKKHKHRREGQVMEGSKGSLERHSQKQELVPLQRPDVALNHSTVTPWQSHSSSSMAPAVGTGGHSRQRTISTSSSNCAGEQEVQPLGASGPLWRKPIPQPQLGVSAEQSPEMDPHHTTMMWISQLKGGPQPLVSPLPPSLPSQAAHPLSEVVPSPPSSHAPPVALTKSADRSSEGCLSTSSKSRHRESGKNRRQSKETSASDATSPSKAHQCCSSDAQESACSRDEKKRRSSDVVELECSKRKRAQREEEKRGKTGVQAQRLAAEVALVKERNAPSSVPSSLSSASTPAMSVDAACSAVVEGATAAAAPATEQDKDYEHVMIGEHISDDELEGLYHRLVCLRRESNAKLVDEVLRRHFKPGDRGCGVDIIELPHNYPDMIAFDLKKLPISCIMELAQILSAEERALAVERNK